jgi:uncharacterized damage-inducible protein DinB
MKLIVMGMQNIITNYARYNHWANEKLSHWLLSLDPAILDRQTPSSFPTVALTVRHMQQSQLFWLGIITKMQPGLPGDITTPETDFGRLLAGSTLMVAAFTAYTEKELTEEVESIDMAKPRHEFILHAINHNTYHRGQIVTMCRSLGVVDHVPAMDYEVFLWSER